MFGSFLHPLFLPTFFSPIGLPPLNAEGEGELWEMGGGQMDTKSPKPMTTYSRRIFTPVNGKLVISAQEIQEIRGDFVCGMNEFFSPTFSISSKFLVEERSPRGLTVVVRRQTGTRQRL